MSKVLITGASGFLGSALMAAFEKEHEVVGLGFQREVEGLVVADIRVKEVIAGLLDREQPDVVVHAAAYRDPDYCEAHPEEAARLNVDSTRYLASLLPSHVQLIYISSDYVFDGKHPPYAEQDERCPVNVYGQQKVASEDIVLERPGSVVLRIPVLIGQDLPGKPGFITKMREVIDACEAPLELDDVLMRFPTWTVDVARVVVFLVAQKASGIFHASSAHGGTRYALNREMADFLTASYTHVKPSHHVVIRGAERPGDSQLSTEKLEKAGFSGIRPLVEVLEVLDI